MIKEHPFSGAGLADWKVFFPAYGSANAVYFNSGSIRFQHPHNEMLFIAAENGLPALVFFLLIFLTSFYYVKRIIRSATAWRERLEALILFSGIAGFLVISFFSMPLQRFYPTLLLILMLAFLSNNFFSLNYDKSFFLPSAVIKTIIFFSLAISITGVIAGVKRWISDTRFSNALYSHRYSHYSRMLRELNKTDSFIFPLDNLGTPVAWYKGIGYYSNNDLNNAIEMFRKAEKVNPYHLQVLNDLGNCYNLSGNPQTAKSYFNKALLIAPTYGDALLNLSVIYYYEGQIDSAYYTIIKYKESPTIQSEKVLTAILKAKGMLKE